MSESEQSPRDRQVHFVHELVEEVEKSLLKDILAGKTPEEWDGHELRCLVAQRFIRQSFGTVIKRAPSGSRARAFRNHCLVTGI